MPFLKSPFISPPGRCSRGKNRCALGVKPAHVQQLECYKVALLSMRATSSSSPGPELTSFQRYFSSFLDSQLALYSLAPLLVMLCYANNHSNSKLHHQQRPSIGVSLRFPLQLHGRLPLRLYHHRWRHHTLVFHPDGCQQRSCHWSWSLGIL